MTSFDASVSPELCPEDIWKIIKQCLATESTSRLSFTDLTKKLSFKEKKAIKLFYEHVILMNPVPLHPTILMNTVHIRKT